MTRPFFARSDILLGVADCVPMTGPKGLVKLDKVYQFSPDSAVLSEFIVWKITKRRMKYFVNYIPYRWN